MTTLIFFLAATSISAISIQSQQRALDNRQVFSPRMDYDEWTPLGQGDPLKNDPTYDYVPPVLDRVHYWMDPSKRTPDPPLPNAGVMVLGSRTDLPSTTAVPATSRLGTMSLIDPFIKFMESSKASLGLSTPVSNYFRPTPNPPDHIVPAHNHVYYGPAPPPPQEPAKAQAQPRPSSHESPNDHALQRPPYTMLMPPPLPSPTEFPMTSFGTTIKSTTEIDEDLATVSEESTTIAPSTTPLTSTTSLANSENYYKPVAINMPESISNETTLPKQEKEETLPLVSLLSGSSNYVTEQEVKLPSMIMLPPPEKSDDFFEFRPTTIRTTTTSRTLTTDPIFKHYKQPKEPMRGPFYLIIQGHSKVKTYGASRNKIKTVSRNEINYGDGKKMGEDEEDLVSQESYRRERKLQLEHIIDEENAEIVEGHPTIELSAIFKTKGQTGFSVSDNDPNLETLEDAFSKGSGGSSKKRLLVNETTRRKRSPGRSLLAVVPNEEKKKDKPNLDKDQLGLESLIAISDDYNSEDVLNLLLKQEGQGSGLGGLVYSLLGRSQTNEEM